MSNRVEHPAPHRHLSGTLALIERIAGSDPHPCLQAVRELLDRPQQLPKSLAPEADSLKYDVYRCEGPRLSAWGVTINDCHEQQSWFAEVERFATRLPGNYDWALARALRDFAPTGTRFTLGVGFDHPSRPPRLKLYVQEERWARSPLTATGVQRWLGEHLPGSVLPDWLEAERRIGVATLELLPDASKRFKVYVGAATALEAARGAPTEVQDLASAMANSSPLPGLFHYVTVRVAQNEPARYALNKIYNPVRIYSDTSGRAYADTWSDVERLFARGARASGQRLRELFGAPPGLYVVPTASALEDEGRSADVYCAAWRLDTGG